MYIQILSLDAGSSLKSRDRFWIGGEESTVFKVGGVHAVAFTYCIRITIYSRTGVWDSIYSEIRYS